MELNVQAYKEIRHISIRIFFYQNSNFQQELLKGHIVDPGSARRQYPWMARLGRIFVHFSNTHRNCLAIFRFFTLQSNTKAYFTFTLFFVFFYSTVSRQISSTSIQREWRRVIVKAKPSHLVSDCPPYIVQRNHQYCPILKMWCKEIYHKMYNWNLHFASHKNV